MASLADMDSACLLILVEEAETTGRPITAKQVAAKFHPATTDARAKISLNHLVSLGLASSNFDNWRASGYQVTRAGLATAERAFEREDTDEHTVWKASRAELSDLIPSHAKSIKTSGNDIQTTPQVVVNVENNLSSHPQKSDKPEIAWAGWVGVIVAITIGAISIAIMKDWL
ncbi:hypothetical protein P8Q88_14765 [Qipengyuania sp. XHP0207]|uniref:hypothetical protein n=1 Tax=Qipengyuania sp. XHP0207 TaxID=3038078 RepID=UPI00241F52AB|nr:hypothetical protein [Qipengyuania sp. XHP0207]MDG5749438.1 hypothetical protein [Qipengyuania sp. XHP0207]